RARAAACNVGHPLPLRRKLNEKGQEGRKETPQEDEVTSHRKDQAGQGAPGKSGRLSFASEAKFREQASQAAPAEALPEAWLDSPSPPSRRHRKSGRPKLTPIVQRPTIGNQRCCRRRRWPSTRTNRTSTTADTRTSRPKNPPILLA